MKAISEIKLNNKASVHSGKITKNRKDGENEEIQMYLSKLKDLVPFMPKNRKLSILEVIENVIDYICDLESALGSQHSLFDNFDPSLILANNSHLNLNLNLNQSDSESTIYDDVPCCNSSRQPLGTLYNLPNHKMASSTTTITSSDIQPTSNNVSNFYRQGHLYIAPKLVYFKIG